MNYGDYVLLFVVAFTGAAAGATATTFFYLSHWKRGTEESIRRILKKDNG